MKLFKHSSQKDYIQAQTRKNRDKLNLIAVSDEELMAVATHIKTHIPGAKFGICHGVRNGYEVQTLRRLLSIEVIGTDIAPTAVQFPNVIQWDFHEVKKEWVGRLDFIYSNAWDHSYDPKILFKNWVSCLNSGGRLFLQWAPYNADNVDDADCFAASLDELKTLLADFGSVEADLPITQWRTPGKSFLYNAARMALRRFKPIKTVHLIVVRPLPGHP